MNISEQVKEILESTFSETKEELIDCAVNSINYCIENVKRDYEKKLLHAKEKEKNYKKLIEIYRSRLDEYTKIEDQKLDRLFRLFNREITDEENLQKSFRGKRSNIIYIW